MAYVGKKKLKCFALQKSEIAVQKSKIEKREIGGAET